MTLYKLVVQDKKPRKLGAFLVKNGFSKQAINDAKNHQGLLLVNHKRRYTSFQLQRGDEVIFVPGKEKTNPWLRPISAQVEIIAENTNYLVVNKPAGLLSIPSRYDDDALVNRVLSYFAQNKVPDAKPHVVTRLDRNTSGLVLIGKNAIAHARFSKLSKADFVKKYYAIVHGNFAAGKTNGIVDAPIGRVGTAVLRGVQSDGKQAVTAYRVLDQLPGVSLVELRLYTGRTHQIRVHLQYLNHPLFGDPLYGITDEFNRQALHCFYLAFPDPFTGQPVELEIPAASDMQQLWQNLQRKKGCQ
ncbi:RluA family pseudouridine synthase [Lactobacillus xylocopicola]|uniref:Pseudouridine synthase n=1 Tax=Lactobacillus xylocopicola TaxID=2976676 RepID=A0ABN6SIQ1_9LACO|nr:RluA family pseudouridine synthase [Lactobacillus xylocopicola]BDR60221.1 RNA pseudouridine synthase [Lactobacillus xylocopicola]